MLWGFSHSTWEMNVECRNSTVFSRTSLCCLGRGDASAGTTGPWAGVCPDLIPMCSGMLLQCLSLISSRWCVCIRCRTQRRGSKSCRSPVSRGTQPAPLLRVRMAGECLNGGRAQLRLVRPELETRHCSNKLDIYVHLTQVK